MTVAVYHNTTESRAFHSPYSSCMRALDQRKRAAYAARELRNFSGRDVRTNILPGQAGNTHICGFTLTLVVVEIYEVVHLHTTQTRCSSYGKF